MNKTGKSRRNKEKKMPDICHCQQQTEAFIFNPDQMYIFFVTVSLYVFVFCHHFDNFYPS